jgi:peptidoglycan L-alanyl-D-glutamate endopeptidase CwlK
MINSRNIDDLKPEVAALCRSFILECDSIGIDVVITSTYRDEDSQNALYAKGRTVPGARVTNVAGGDSFHNWRVAFDFVPIANGKACWDDPTLWNRCGSIAEKLGLEWGGAWERFTDKPHCQYTGGMTIAQFKSGSDRSVA